MPSALPGRSGAGPAKGTYAGHGASFLPTLLTSWLLAEVEQAASTDGAAMAAPPAAIERSRVRRENDEVLTVVLSGRRGVSS